MIELIIAFVVISFAIFFIIKKHDTKLIMFLSGLVLLACAFFLNKPLLETPSTGMFGFFDIFTVISSVFTKQLTSAGFIIMLLFGYTTYMSAIKANDVTIYLLSKCFKRGYHSSITLALLFIVGNLLCLIIPSASSLSVLLMSSLFPILVSGGMSALSVAAIIATSATIAPTPLGADNLVASSALNMSVVEYTFTYHAPISLIVLVIMLATHLVWQRYCDSKEGVISQRIATVETSENLSQPYGYVVLPLLPLLLMIIAVGIFGQNVSITQVCLFSFAISVVCEMVRGKSLDTVQSFFDGMGRGFSLVVAQVVCALIFVEGLKLLGVITILSDAVTKVSGASFILVLTFCLISFGVGMLSGSGLALFYAFVELIPTFASATGMSPVLLAIPMQFVSHFTKSVSLVSPTVIITSTMMKTTPLQLVKRTSVPIFVATIATFILSFLIL